MTSSAQRLRGVAALAALALLLVGVPVALVTWGGDLVPSGSAGEWLQEPLSTDGVLGVLTVVMWLAWAHFTVAVIREVMAHRRAGGVRTAPATRHPLARRLVAAALLVATTTAVGAQTAQAAESAHVASASLHRAPRSEPATGPADAAAESGRGAATPADDRRALAHRLERLAPEGHRVSAAAASRGPVQHSVRHQLGLGYRVQPPHGRHHDSLWDIAERTLGDGRRWTDLYELNKDRAQPDGSRLQDADLIYPGWHLVMPDDATGDDIRGLPPAAGADAGAAAQSQAPSAAVDGPDRATGLGTAEDAGGSSSAELGAGLGSLGGLVVAGLLFGLRRRRGWDGGPPRGRGPLDTDTEELHLAPDMAAAEVANRGLRRLSGHLGRPRAAAPALRTVRLSADRLTVAFERAPEQAPPTGWRVLGDGRVWTVDAGSLDVSASALDSAYGQLVAVGRDHGEHILIDTTGRVVRFGGDQGAVDALLHAMVVDLATHAWADDLVVVALGLTDLTGIGADRLVSATDLASVPTDVVAGRAVAVVSRDEPDDTALRRLRRHARDVSVLTATPVRDAADVVVEARGRLTSPRYGVFAQAAGLDRETARRLVTVFGAVPEPTEPLPGIAGFAARVLDPSAPTAADVRVLGPVRVTGSGFVEPDRADVTREIVAYLALHPDGVHERVLAGAIWPRGSDDDMLAAAMARVEAFLETAREPDDEADGPGPPVLHVDAGRWSLDLSEVRVDWHVFRTLVAQAPGGPDVAAALLRALRLVEGPPFSDLPLGRYPWLEAGTLVADVSTAIVQVALAASSHAVGDGDEATATEALQCGLRAAPGAEPLWQALLRRSAADGGDHVRTTADEMYDALRRHGSPLGPHAATDALVAELLPDYPLPARGRTLTA